MSDELVIRSAAVVAAAVLLALPYRDAIADRFLEAAAAARQHGALIGRIAAAALLLAAAWGKLPMPTLPSVPAPVTVETPSDEMRAAVKNVCEVMDAASLTAADRALWAETWNKIALVVAGDAVSTEVAFTDTRALRGETALAIDIAWRRIGGHAPGSVAGLRDAVEAAYGRVVGTDVVPVTPDLRGRYVDLARALAWAGVR